MKQLFLILFIFAFTHFQAQEINEDRTSKNQIYQVADKMPQYPGGMTEMLDYVQKNLKYPEVKGKKIEGNVLIKFIIGADGKVYSVDILESLHPDYDKEAMRVVNSFPDWIPGENEGETVNVQLALPINFKL